MQAQAWPLSPKKYLVTRRGNPSSSIFMQPITLENVMVAAAAVTTVVTPPCPSNRVATILSIAARDQNNAIATYIEIGIMDGTKKILIDSTPGNFPANTSMTLYWPCLLREGQRIYATFTTPSADDKLEVVAHGYTEPCEERVSVFRAEIIDPHFNGGNESHEKRY